MIINGEYLKLTIILQITREKCTKTFVADNGNKKVWWKCNHQSKCANRAVVVEDIKITTIADLEWVVRISISLKMLYKLKL